MVEDLDSKMTESGTDLGDDEPLEVPKTRWPFISGIALIITMGLLFLTAWLSYYSGEYIEDMDGDGPLEGIVYERLHGKDVPVEGVNVSIEGTDIWQETDSSGYYRIDHAPAGIQSIKFSKPGFKTIILKDIIYTEEDLEGGDVESNNISFPNNQRGGLLLDPFERHIDHQTLTLSNGVFYANIINITGAPVSNLNVSYIESDYDTTVSKNDSKPVDIDGTGTLFLNLTAGRYVLFIASPGNITVHQEIMISPNKNNSMEIQMHKGTGTQEFLLEQTLAISGKIQTVEGEPIPDVQVAVEGTGLYTMTNIAGEYVLEGIPPGLRTISAKRINYSVSSIEIFLDENKSQDFSLEKLGVEVVDNSDYSLYYYCAAFYIIGAIILLAGGIMALKRKSYGVALLGAVVGIIFAFPLLPLLHHCIAIILCLVALIGVYLSRREFG
ncbi:MAG: carboxypeptidase regulatory-like domain-containing protein [Thermoplasmata archaeon]|nr:MAG: carboxypeptidase regulatory-like domain-containing protein [Thermoplasmata archaeon]